MDFKNIIADWIGFIQKINKYSENTQEAYISDFNFFLKFLESEIFIKDESKNLSNLKISDFRGFLAYLTNDRKRTVASKARTISTIKNFYKFFNEKYPESKNEVIFLIKTPKFNKPLPRALDVPSTFKALEGAPQIEHHKKNYKDWASLRDETLLKLIYSSGLRISEALEIKIGDLDRNYLKVIGKGGKERMVPFLAEVKNEILNLTKICPYIEPENKESLVFFGKGGKKLDPAVFQKTIRSVKNNLGLEEGTTPHAFRHSFATHLLSNSSDILSVKELLGHTSISTTQIYTKVDKKRILDNFAQFENN